MIKLFAVPFDTYKSEKTNQGIIYNIVDVDQNVHCQCWVAHRKYADNDLCIKEDSSAPNNVRKALIERFDRKFGEGNWRVVTRFSIQQKRQSTILNDDLTLNFTDDCVMLLYNDKKSKLVVREPNEMCENGLVY